jgi:cytoskeletal protein CcmA (bactofilin family)
MDTNNSAHSTSLLSRNANIEGEIHGNENLKIEGYLKGSIRLNGDIHIGSTGIVEADIKAINVIIEGTVTGNVFANEHLEIQSSGKMTGDITARSIDIQEGSTFEGRSHMIKSDQSKTIADPSLVASNSTTTDNE